MPASSFADDQPPVRVHGPTRERLFGGGTSPAAALAVDDAYVYAVDRMRGSVSAWPKDGRPLELVVPESAGAMSLTADETSLYVGTLGSRDDATAGVRVISKATRTSRTLRAGERNAKLAVTGTTLFTAELDARGTTRIVRSSLRGGDGEVVGQASAPPTELLTEAGEAYWIDSRGLMSSRAASPVYASPPGGFLAGGLSLSDGEAYVTRIEQPGTSDGKILRVSLAAASYGASALVAVLSVDAPAGAFRAYGIRQTRDQESIYVTTYWTSNTGSARGDAIVKVPFPAKVF